MTEDWLKKLTSQQREREEKRVQEEAAKARDQAAFDEAAAPFWAAVQVELRRLVAEYNQTIGREDLVIPNEGARLHTNRPDELEIHRGAWTEAHCCVSLSRHGRVVNVDYSSRDEGSTSYSRSMKIPLAHDEHGVRGQVPDGGEPAAVARAILGEWAGKFPSTPPRP